MRRPTRVKWPAVVAAGVVLAGSGTAYAVVGGEDTPNYRTVTAGTGDVEQTLTMSGTVDAARRSDLAFGTAGTVAKVKVAEGDTVKAGQVVAVLDTGDLDAEVTGAEATLAKARAQLESDQSSQTASVVQAVSTPSGGSGSSSGHQGAGSGSTANAAVLKKLEEQQQAVLTAQSKASAALAVAADSLAAQTAACADAYQTSTPPADDGGVADDGATDAPADTTGSNAANAANAACDAALLDVQEQQAAVKDAQDALQDALTDLGRTLTSALGSVSGSPTTAARTASSAASSAASSGGTGSTGSPGGTVTAARLASDQAAIDQAAADLVSAKAERSQAVLRSTRTGTVVQLDLAKGDQVSTGTTVAVVVGGAAVTLTGTVGEASIAKVEVGQTARVTVPGSSTSATGTVTAIGLTASSGTGSTSYPVTVTVEDPTIALPTGSSAQVAIVVATAGDVLTLPVSAITRNGDSAGNASVRVWDGSTLTTTRVTLGAVGARTVAVTDGVEAGTEVVLADVDQEITGASSELNQRGGFGGPPGGVTFRQGGPGGNGRRGGSAAN